ncbi:50S ribosomal protein L10 [Rubrobacter taiwanensis]|jgi:large subunit ribosomal protein L10|uniref:Large ribosomal subunit protein uL10 n=1 Tax=Rubrobacter taiwanensis TaxID=185139 RepID=A0A4R1BMY4_9ACTN|nr:50S ribosomal protein L10 [Rubrobacter taiwanensis]TCJ18688.1 50S ribosomal protein L10 [Rubrobacter taiwanensis]
MKREEKARVIEELTEKLQGNSVIAVNYQGLNVARSNELRARSREAGVEFLVVKNTLARRAAEAAGAEALSEFMVGPTAVALSQDPVASAKLMTEIAGDVETFEIKGGLLDGGRLVSAAEVEQLSRLPGREQLLAQVVGGFQAPIAGLVNVLNGTIRNLAVVLNQVAQQKGAGS